MQSHGGLAIFLNNNFNLIHSRSYVKSTIWEAQSIEISIYRKFKRTLVLGNVYRPPRDLNENDQTFINEFTPVLYDLQKRQCEVVIAGDYNIDLLKVKQKPIFYQYLDTLISLSFFPKITLPTRLSNKRGNLIDNFLCKFSHGFL